MTKVLVIGFGSIGQRHATILKNLGCEVSILSFHATDAPYPTFKTLQSALRILPDYIIIANETERHYDTLSSLVDLEYRGKVFIEKPIFHTSAVDFNKFRHLSQQIYVGYVIRFNPLLAKAKEWLQWQTIYAMNIYCGQYLPDWRTNNDYTRSYSAKNLGGGVIRDLSHELDYMQWLVGSWTSVIALGGHITSLDIESEDAISCLVKTEHCKQIACQLNIGIKITSVTAS